MTTLSACGDWGVGRCCSLFSQHSTPAKAQDMNKLSIFICVTIMGWVGWWLGAKIGIMTGYILSGIGSLLGVYVGWRINRDYLE